MKSWGGIFSMLIVLVVLNVVFFNLSKGSLYFLGGVWGGFLLSLSLGLVGLAWICEDALCANFILFLWGFLVHSMFFYFLLLSLPLIAAVFCCGCSFLFSIVWFCLCFNVFFCVIFKCFSAITFLYCIIIFLSLAGVWFYTSFDDSFYTFVLTLTAPVQLVTIVYNV